MPLTPEEAKNQLDQLIQLNLTAGENEWFEFKEAKTQMDINSMGEYFSALSNEANLKKQRYGWLVLGVNDKGIVVGTSWRKGVRELKKLKAAVADHTLGNITFEEIYEINDDRGRVLLLQIPAAPLGMPISWKGHYYGRIGESLAALDIIEQDIIRAQKDEDWSAQICPDATLDDLDPEAIQKARTEFIKRNPRLASEVPKWDDLSFLNKACITINGKITRAAIVLLGRNESHHFLTPYVAELTWVKQDESGIKKEFAHFGPPFILTIDLMFSRIQNPRYVYNQPDTLFPYEVPKYDQTVIRELLNNCIAHSDYRLRGRISIVESDDKLIFANSGHFIPGTLENVFERAYMPPYYRNFFLASAMVGLNMIEKIANGIVSIFENQRKRLFPLPDYDLTEKDRVKVTVYGSVLNPNYTKLLIKNTSLPLPTVILLDKVQKQMRISKQESDRLKRMGVVEGRYPNLHISSNVALQIGDIAGYFKNKALDDDYYKHLILTLIQLNGSATKANISELLSEKLPEFMTLDQRENKVKNLIKALKNEEKIIRIGERKGAKWILPPAK